MDRREYDRDCRDDRDRRENDRDEQARAVEAF